MVGTWVIEEECDWIPEGGSVWAWEKFEFTADGNLAGRPYEVYGNGIKYSYENGSERYMRMKMKDGKLLMVEADWNTQFIASYKKIG